MTKKPVPHWDNLVQGATVRNFDLEAICAALNTLQKGRLSSIKLRKRDLRQHWTEIATKAVDEIGAALDKMSASQKVGQKNPEKKA